MGTNDGVWQGGVFLGGVSGGYEKSRSSCEGRLLLWPGRWRQFGAAPVFFWMLFWALLAPWDMSWPTELTS